MLQCYKLGWSSWPRGNLGVPVVCPARSPGAALLSGHGQIRHVLVPRWALHLVLHLHKAMMLYHSGSACFRVASVLSCSPLAYLQ